jgi:hypothetical protein
VRTVITVVALALVAACTDAPAAVPTASPVQTPGTPSAPSPAPSADPPTPTELPPTATPADTPAEPASPTPTVAETFAPTDEAPPELMLTGEDFDAIVRSHEAYRDWLYGHPDPDLLDAIYHPDCECLADERLLVGSYEEQGRWWIGEPTHVRSVEVIDDFAPHVRTLRIVLERTTEEQLVDSSGVVHERLDPRGPWVEENVYLRRDESAPWLLRSYLDLGSQEGSDA